MKLYHWEGAGADKLWQEHLDEQKAEAERLRHRAEVIDE